MARVLQQGPIANIINLHHAFPSMPQPMPHPQVSGVSSIVAPQFLCASKWTHQYMSQGQQYIRLSQALWVSVSQWSHGAPMHAPRCPVPWQSFALKTSASSGAGIRPFSWWWVQVLMQVTASTSQLLCPLQLPKPLLSFKEIHVECDCLTHTWCFRMGHTGQCMTPPL